jgi:hypothetical protein
VVEPAADAVRLRGVLTDGGVPRATGERLARRRDAVAAEADALVRELFARGGVVAPSVWQSPVLWTAFGVATLTGAIAGYVVWINTPSRIVVGPIGTQPSAGIGP